MKRVLLLTTGGTISSAPTYVNNSEAGFTPPASMPGISMGLAPMLSGEELLRFIPELDEFCDVVVEPVMNLDSSNMQPEDWITIARALAANMRAYDGFVITHGTDTMAYTSSMLSFMLRGLEKPVLLTGSQIPILERGSDARKNLLDSFLTATASGIAGVFVVFNGKIINGTRAFKMSTEDRDAYVSRNYPYAGRITDYEVELRVRRKPTDDTASDGLTLMDRIEQEVFLLKLIPGTRPEVLPRIIEMGYKGIVIESFGAGGIPYFRRNLLTEVERVVRAGIPVVLLTQCPYDGTHLDVYDIGVKAEQAGVISGKDMTTEAAVTKLMWTLGQTSDPTQIKAIMHRNICGEITAMR